MKERIKNFLGVLLVCAIWAGCIALVFYLTSCNSSHHLQTSSVLQDSTVKMGKDCTLVSSSREANRESNETITRMLFGLQESIDAKGNPVTNVYPKEYVTIDRGSREQVVEKKDSIRYIDTSSAKVRKLEEQLDKANKTEVLPKWWLLAALGIGILTRFLKIQIRR